jgi:hypothetical protein
MGKLSPIMELNEVGALVQLSLTKGDSIKNNK